MKSYKAEQVFDSFVRGDRVATISPLLEHGDDNLYQIERAKMKRKLGHRKVVAFKAFRHIFYPELHRGSSQVLRFLKHAPSAVQLYDEEWQTFFDSARLLDQSLYRLDRSPNSSSIWKRSTPLDTINSALETVNAVFTDNHISIRCDTLLDYLNKRRYEGRFIAAYKRLDQRGIEIEGDHETVAGWTLVAEEHDDCLLTIGASFNSRVKLSV